MLKRRIKFLLKAALVSLVLVFVGLLLVRWRGQISLASYKRELLAKGERLDFRKLTASPVAETNNAVPEISRLAALLPAYDNSPTNRLPPCMKIIAPGKALIGHRETYWINRDNSDNTNTWETTGRALAGGQQTLSNISKLLKQPVLQQQIDYSRGINFQLPHLAQERALRRWFAVSAQWELHAGKPDAAFENLMALCALPRMMENDRFLISEGRRCQIATQTLGVTWEAVQSGSLNEEQLLRLQAAWERSTFLTNFTVALEMERALQETNYRWIIATNDAEIDVALASAAFHVNPDWMNLLPHQVAKSIQIWGFPKLWRFALASFDERQGLVGLQGYLSAARTVAETKSLASVTNELIQLEETYSLGCCHYTAFPVSDWCLSGVRSQLTRTLLAETQRSLVICAIALKRYQLRHQEMPSSLQALVPEFLSTLPIDYMDGAAMKYRKKPDGSFTLYSVGADSHDDGGDARSLSNPDQRSFSDIWGGRDAVWPAPASDKDLEEHRQAVGIFGY